MRHLLRLHGGRRQRPPSELQLVFDVCLAVAYPLAIISSANGLHRVVAHGGELAQLGAGEQRISARALRGLARAHIFMLVMVFFGMLMFLICCYSASRVGTYSYLSGRLITASYARVVFFSGFGGLHWCTIFAWWLTLKIASTLVMDAVAEAQQAIQRTSPVDPQWDDVVVPQVVELCDSTLKLLSQGWGSAVGFAFAGYGLAAVAFLSLFLESRTTFSVVQVLFWSVAPLSISYDAAVASSECDLLSDVLNEKRKRGPKNDADFEHALQVIETILDRENTQQGLGFTVGGRILNMMTLSNIVGAVFGVLVVVIPVIFSLAPTDAAVSDGVLTSASSCALTEVQIAGLAAWRDLLGNATSCSYNISITPNAVTVV